MFSESLDFIYQKCKRKQLGFPFFFFVTTKQNKMKKSRHTCRCCYGETHAEFNEKIKNKN